LAKPSPADLARSKPPEKASDSEDEAEQTPAETPTDNPSTETPSGVEPSEPERDAVPAGAADQKVIGKATELVPEPQQVPSEAASLPSTTQSTPDQAPEPAPEIVDEPAEAPRPVTSTRRRTARRPAGPPVVQTSEVTALSDVAPRSGAGREAAPSAEPVAVPVEPASSGHAPEPDPRADEDATSSTDGAWPADPSVDAEPGDGPTGDDLTEEGGASSLTHVPIKRKGSRKR
jgi:ribonuclease E